MLATKKGFTLIECLVALFIIAVLLATATKAIGIAINSIRDNFTKEVASWVASDKYYSMKADKIYPALGENVEDVTNAGTEFIVKTKTLETPNPYFRKIEITVSTKTKPDYILFKTVNFFAQY